MENQTVGDVVKEIWPGITDAEADELVWSVTAFPFCGIDTLKQQLTEAYAKHNGNVKAAVAEAHAEMDRAHAELMKRQAEETAEQ